jgi:glycine cleavage system H protein
MEGGNEMKELAELNFPDDLRYAEDHEWTRQEGDEIRVGISDYAQDQLGDITFAELPGEGDTFEKGEEFGNLESTKAVSELFIPIGGEIVAVNEELAESPGLVNEDPYGKGWIILVKPDDVSGLEALMTRDAYRTYLEGLE